GQSPRMVQRRSLISRGWPWRPTWPGSPAPPVSTPIRPALLPVLVHRARPGPAGRPPPAPGAVHPVDAGDPPLQALHGVAAVLSRGRFLPELWYPRPARTPPPPARPPAIRAPPVPH